MSTPSIEQTLAGIEAVTNGLTPVETAPTVQRRDVGYFNRQPWFGITDLPDGEYTNAATMLEAAGLDWTVEFGKLFREVEVEQTDPDSDQVIKIKTLLEATDVKDVVRSSDGFVLGQVGSDYKRVQNAEAFQFADNLVDLADGRWIAAGEQYGGRMVFGVMELRQGEVQIGGEDPFGMYLLVRTSHNGATGVQVSIVPMRIRCQNMISLANLTAKSRWSFRHVGTLDGQVAKARQALTLTHAYSDVFELEMEKLLSMNLSTDGAKDMITRVFEKESATKLPKMVNGVMSAWDNDQYNGYAGTGYGLLNAVTDYFDHDVNRRSATSRFQEQTDGEGAKYRNRVHAALLERV